MGFFGSIADSASSLGSWFGRGGASVFGGIYGVIGSSWALAANSALGKAIGTLAKRATGGFVWSNEGLAKILSNFDSGVWLSNSLESLLSGGRTIAQEIGNAINYVGDIVFDIFQLIPYAAWTARVAVWNVWRLVSGDETYYRKHSDSHYAPENQDPRGVELKQGQNDTGHDRFIDRQLEKNSSLDDDAVESDSDGSAARDPEPNNRGYDGDFLKSGVLIASSESGSQVLSDLGYYDDPEVYYLGESEESYNVGVTATKRANFQKLDLPDGRTYYDEGPGQATITENTDEGYFEHTFSTDDGGNVNVTSTLTRPDGTKSVIRENEFVADKSILEGRNDVNARSKALSEIIPPKQLNEAATQKTDSKSMPEDHSRWKDIDSGPWYHDPTSSLKAYTPAPFTNTVVRKDAYSKVGGDYYPDENLRRHIMSKGFDKVDRLSTFTAAEHALNEQMGRRTPFVSASNLLLGAERYKGERFWIDLDKIERAGVRVIKHDELVQMVEQYGANFAKERPSLETRVPKWIRGQANELEVLLDLSNGEIPTSAIETQRTRIGKFLGRGFYLYGLAVSAEDLGEAYLTSKETKTWRPLVGEATTQAATWGVSAALTIGVTLGAKAMGISAPVTGPASLLIGFGVGLIFGGLVYFYGDEVADFFVGEEKIDAGYEWLDEKYSHLLND